MADTLAQLRARLSEDQRKILDYVRDQYTAGTPNSWPSAQEVEIVFGQTKVREALSSLPPGTVPLVGGHYQLGLLGLLLGSSGGALEGLLVRYLEHLRDEAIDNPRIAEVTSAQLGADLSLTEDDLRLLGLGVMIGILNGGFGANDSGWHARVPEDLASYPEIGDFRAFVHARALRLAGADRAPQAESANSSTVMGYQSAASFAIPWGPVRFMLSESSFSSIREIAGLSGVNVLALSGLDQTKKHTKDQLLTAIDAQLAAMTPQDQQRVITSVAEVLLQRKGSLAVPLNELLGRLGWTFTGGRLLPIELLDVGELPGLPTESHEDLTKAAARLRDGDLSGAISSASAAVDATTSAIYAEASLGAPGNDSFQERVSRALDARGVFDRIEQDLVDLGWAPALAKQVAKNLKGSINQATFVIQSLRSGMGDVHGTKPTLQPLVYDALKFSALILRLLTPSD